MTLSSSTLYLIRHATPDWSRTDLVYHLPPGPPLTPQGEDEATQLGAFLRDAGVRRILASPLERCQRTAQIAAGEAEASFHEDASLAEWRPEEKEIDVRERLWPTWERVASASPGTGPAAFVTHGGPIAVLLKDLGLDEIVLEHYRKLFDRHNPLPPAGAWKATRPSPGSAWELSLAFTPEAYRKSLMV
ncbi:MAG: histidine phosphatase family protein [Chloroflexi bacterium]|nr:histidine phosphatase family protein [Chloroflexota bacterium]